MLLQKYQTCIRRATRTRRGAQVLLSHEFEQWAVALRIIPLSYYRERNVHTQDSLSNTLTPSPVRIGEAIAEDHVTHYATAHRNRGAVWTIVQGPPLPRTTINRPLRISPVKRRLDQWQMVGAGGQRREKVEETAMPAMLSPLVPPQSGTGTQRHSPRPRS